MATARETYSALAAAVRESLPPGLGRDGHEDAAGAMARRGHTAATMEQLAAQLGDRPLEMADLALAYLTLGATAGQPGPERSRRWTCRQLGILARQLGGEHGTVAACHSGLLRALGAWLRAQEAAQTMVSLGDPRGASMAATDAREVQELQRELGALAEMLAG